MIATRMCPGINSAGHGRGQVRRHVLAQWQGRDDVASRAFYHLSLDLFLNWQFNEVLILQFFIDWRKLIPELLLNKKFLVVELRTFYSTIIVL